jgi:8-oxo-dGTP diphosphatase
MRSWLVGGAVIEGPEGLLLVQNRRRSGAVDWSPPGGVIDQGESLLEGLTREVAEETGLSVTRWSGPLYEIEAEAPDLGWSLRVEAHLAVEVGGELVIDDPDGIVVDACYVPCDACAVHLAAAHPWVREPLTDWLESRWTETRRFSYRIDGADPAQLRVSRSDDEAN